MGTGMKITIAAVAVAGLTTLGLFLPDMVKDEDSGKTEIYEEPISYEETVSSTETVEVIIEESAEEIVEESVVEYETETAEENEFVQTETESETVYVEETVIVQETEVQSSAETVSHGNYIGNIKSEKVHSLDCDTLPYEKNRTYFNTYEEAVAEGYEPCQNCNPQPK